jgi:hypothetical protein
MNPIKMASVNVEETRGFREAQGRVPKHHRPDPIKSSLPDKSFLNLSPFRQEQITEQLEKAKQDHSPRANLGTVISSSKETMLRKNASGSAGGVSSHLSGAGSVNALSPDLYSPLYLTSNLMLPRDRLTANAWNRAFYETNPLVRNAINLHATYPISKLNIKCEDKTVERFFEDMCDKINLLKVVQDTSLEFWKLGEVFNYASFDQSSGMWDMIYQLNPDYVLVKNSLIPNNSNIMALKPDAELTKIVMGMDPLSMQMKAALPPSVVQHVLKNEPIPLDAFNISHLKNHSSPQDARGQSIIVSVWKDLVMLDKYRECKLAQANSMVNPLTLIQIGASNSDGNYPRQEELDAWRAVFEAAQYDKDFKIFTHPDVKVTPVGYSGQTLDITQDVAQAMDNIMTGLMVPKAIMTQEGSPYANASVALDVMRQRYNNFRGMMANWLEKKIFAPISEIQGFYRYKDGKKHLIVPTIEWNHMTLYDVDTYISQLMSLMDKPVPQGPSGVSRKTLYRSLGLDFKDEMANCKKEMIDMTILQKEIQELQKMDLSKLRSLALDPDKPFVTDEGEEGAMPSLPGVPPPGSMDGGGGGSMDAMLGGPSPMDMGAPPPGAGAGAPPEMPPIPGLK